MQNVIFKTGAVALIAVAGVFAVLGMAQPAEAQYATQPTQCVFGRDLYIGAVGEDVRCLQRYLNASGYTVAYTGPGSYGRETYSYGPLTAAAVARWQAATRQQVTGTFRFGALAGNSNNPFVSNPLDGGCTCDDDNRDRNDRNDARRAIDDAEDAIDDADDEIEEADDDGKDVDEAEDLLDDARDELRDARRAYSNGEYDDAVDFAEDAEDLADEAVDEIGSSSGTATESKARDAIEDAEDAIDDAWDEIDEADDDGYDVDDAWDLLDEAEEEYDDAVDAFDDRNWSRAIDHAEEAEELADDAVDEIED